MARKRKTAVPRTKAAPRPRRARATAAALPRPAADALPRPAADALDLEPCEPPVPGNIPWGYGQNRVTGMARDPSWIFVYWELTDEAIAGARAEVQAPDADCILRVYDTTYRLFDGTNANWYMDVPIHRPSNNHYVRVDRPASTLHVDIGVKSHEGYFAKIARSGPVETPRNSISHDTRVEWMTVTPQDGPPAEYAHRFVPRAAAPPGGAMGVPDVDAERIMQSLAGEGWSRTEWTERDMDGRIVRWMRWTGPFWGEHWHSIRVGGDVRVRIVFQGGRRVIRTEHGERVVFGPWHVTIHGLDAAGGRRVIDRWAIRYSWLTERGAVRTETVPILRRILQGYRAVFAQSGSEARLLQESWASESLQMGASEWRWLGGSETWLGGASETLFLGASETLYLGASETLFLGASEVPALGASEALGMGASEALGVGASEALALGASEALGMGASEVPALGASERVLQPGSESRP